MLLDNIDETTRYQLKVRIGSDGVSRNKNHGKGEDEVGTGKCEAAGHLLLEKDGWGWRDYELDPAIKAMVNGGHVWGVHKHEADINLTIWLEVELRP